MNAIEIPPKSTAQLNALGTTVELIAEPLALGDALSCLLHELQLIGDACSHLRPDSELMRLPAAGGRWTAATPLFREALRAGVRGAARRRIEIDDARGCVRVPSDMKIDIAATAKALAADRAAHAAYRATGAGVLVNVGGDIAVAGPAPDGGWPVPVVDDRRGPLDARGETVAIHSGGLATSRTAERRWSTAGDGKVHHILDPGKGAPAAGDWRTVSVRAASCVDANTASSLAIVAGSVAPMWLESLELPARLVGTDGSVVLTSGWPGAEGHAVAA
jgi:thiamine biosynthesis lipoprotein